jgi:hypothetical protein
MIQRFRELKQNKNCLGKSSQIKKLSFLLQFLKTINQLLQQIFFVLLKLKKQTIDHHNMNEVLKNWKTSSIFH